MQNASSYGIAVRLRHISCTRGRRVVCLAQVQFTSRCELVQTAHSGPPGSPTRAMILAGVRASAEPRDCLSGAVCGELARLAMREALNELAQTVLLLALRGEIVRQ